MVDGEIKEPLAIWKTKNENILLDGHNHYKIAEKNNLKFPTTEIELIDRDHAKLWIATHQLGRRNLTDDQRADIANEVREIRATIANTESLAKAREIKANPSAKSSVSAKSTDTVKPKIDTRKAVAIEAKLPERKIRLAQEIKKFGDFFDSCK